MKDKKTERKKERAKYLTFGFQLWYNIKNARKVHYYGGI